MRLKLLFYRLVLQNNGLPGKYFGRSARVLEAIPEDEEADILIINAVLFLTISEVQE